MKKSGKNPENWKQIIFQKLVLRDLQVENISKCLKKLKSEKKIRKPVENPVSYFRIDTNGFMHEIVRIHEKYKNLRKMLQKKKLKKSKNVSSQTLFHHQKNVKNIPLFLFLLLINALIQIKAQIITLYHSFTYFPCSIF